MAKINIPFDNTSYSIEESALASATAELKSHLLATMNGSGAVISFGGTSYNVDSTKLTNATNAFVSHLGTVAGSGLKVIVNGVEYSVDSTKMNNAIADLHTVLGGLQSGGDNEGGSDGIHMTTIPEGAYYGNGLTGEFYATMPETVSESDMFLCGDYLYEYVSDYNGWAVSLATNELPILAYIPNYPVTDTNQSSYDDMFTSVNGVDVTYLRLRLFYNCTNLTSINIPTSVTVIGYSAFENCFALKSIIIPNGVLSIDDRAFIGCGGLENIIISNSVTFIGEQAFEDCASLTSVTYEGTMAQWDAIEKKDGWNGRYGTTPLTKVICSDGEVNLA